MIFRSRIILFIWSSATACSLKEIYRTSGKYIYGSEYFAEELTEIKGYHGETNIAWKRDFAGEYKKLFPDLKLLKEKKYKYTFNDDIDSTFLFEK